MFVHPFLMAGFYFILFYLGMFSIFVLFSDYFTYFPPKNSLFTPSESTHILGSKENPLYASYFPNKSSEYTLLFSHGNAEDLGTMQPLLEYYQSKGYAVFAYDYRGYGMSAGKPSEKGLYEDITTAYEYMIHKLNIPADKIIAYGRSLGSGPTLYLASQNKVGGVILEAPFVTAFRSITYVPIFPFDKFKNIARIQKIEAPVLIIHGKQDTIIPFWHGKTLYQKAHEPKSHLWLKKANHNNILMVDEKAYWQALDGFIATLPEGS